MCAGDCQEAVSVCTIEAGAAAPFTNTMQSIWPNVALGSSHSPPTHQVVPGSRGASLTDSSPKSTDLCYGLSSTGRPAARPVLAHKDRGGWPRHSSFACDPMHLTVGPHRVCRSAHCRSCLLPPEVPSTAQHQPRPELNPPILSRVADTFLGLAIPQDQNSTVPNYCNTQVFLGGFENCRD